MINGNTLTINEVMLQPIQVINTQRGMIIQKIKTLEIFLYKQTKQKQKEETKNLVNIRTRRAR